MPIVVELFTSQGCSSCPPADALLGRLAEQGDILPLAFHVTYWDRLGWPDTLGLEEGTARQEFYARTLGLGRLYTPQMVVDGRVDVVGSDEARVRRALDLIAGHREKGPIVEVKDGRLSVGPGAAPEAVVWLAAYDRRHEIVIERGENRGRTLAYHQAVRELIELGRWRGEALELALPLERLVREGRDGAAILVQRQADGAILGAARIRLAPG
jgi:hypothetical protein